jgi:hypothetical protein
VRNYLFAEVEESGLREMALRVVYPPRADDKTKSAFGVIVVIDCGQVSEGDKVFALPSLGFVVIEGAYEGPIERKACIVIEIAACANGPRGSAACIPRPYNFRRRGAFGRELHVPGPFDATIESMPPPGIPRLGKPAIGTSRFPSILAR